MDQQSGDTIERTPELQDFLGGYLSDELTGLRIHDAYDGFTGARVETQLHAVVQ